MWGRPNGKLFTASIAAAKQLNRRAFDRLCNANIVAVGMFKVAPAPKHYGDRWICEVHEIVAEVEKEELERVFHGWRSRGFTPDTVRVTKITDLAKTINKVFNSALHTWRHPYGTGDEPSPKKRHRTEYYSWLFSLNIGVRTIRYGCDRYFNKLAKKEKVFRPKIKKKHPYPRWLEDHMFGGKKWENIDPHSMTFSPKRKSHVVDPGSDYFSLDDDKN
jgi:hypothetical protein